MSVELQKLRSELMREALLKGWTTPGSVPTPWTTMLPMARIERWYQRLYSAPTEPTPVGARLANHFSLGADPEFVLTDSSGRRCDARTLGLQAGPAYGADNNGRLVELRPAPSRSALSVLASIWLAMRWMTVFYPKTLEYNWRSGGYFAGDGLGGHIHFGRKRNRLRSSEVGALDRITHLLFSAGVFDREEGRLRVRQAQGAPHGQPYGALGDIRPQPHGWEYRTLPSWVDDLWLAYLNLVVGKLVVAFPDMVQTLSEADANLTTEQARGQLRMLLAYFSPFDDDARLAFAILTHRGWPRHAQGLDFKSNWGLFSAGPLGTNTVEKPKVQPSTVPPTTVDEEELASAMFEARAPDLTALKPTWPSTLPDGYVQAITGVDTKLAPGLGEYAMDLCYHKDAPLVLANSGGNGYLYQFPRNLNSVLFEAHKKELQTQLSALAPRLVPFGFHGNDDNIVYMNATKDVNHVLLESRKILVDSGVLPLWFIGEVKSHSLLAWKSRREEAERATKRGGGKALFNSQQSAKEQRQAMNLDVGGFDI